MFYGKPGTGKTTITRAIANYLGYNIELVDVSKIKTTKELKILLYNNFSTHGASFECTKKSIIVFDEFDLLLEKLKPNDSKINQEELEFAKVKSDMLSKSFGNNAAALEELNSLSDKLTYDSLLTCLDGIVQVKGRIIVATTNNLEKIEKRLIRPGRFDLVINLDYYDKEEVCDFLKLHFGEEANNLDFKYPIPVPPCYLSNMIATDYSLKSILDKLENVILEEMCEIYEYIV